MKIFSNKDRFRKALYNYNNYAIALKNNLESKYYIFVLKRHDEWFTWSRVNSTDTNFGRYTSKNSAIKHILENKGKIFTFENNDEFYSWCLIIERIQNSNTKEIKEQDRKLILL